MKVSEFIGKLFEVEVVAHIAHWQTKSFSEHNALGGLYEGIVSLRDRFTEAYQGEYGIVSGYGDIKVQEGVDMVKYITEMCECAESFRSMILKDSYLQQIVDDILELFYSTKYKLVNLK